MDVLWQDNGPSFLDASSPGAGGFVASLGDVGAPWFDSADGGGFSGQPVVWWDNGADSALGRTSGFSLGGASELDGVIDGRFAWIADESDSFSDASALDGRLLWANDSSSTSGSLPMMGQWDLSIGNGAPSQWQQFANDFASHANTWLADASTLLWTGGSAQPPVAPPMAGGSQPMTLVDAGSSQVWSFPTLTSQPLVWTELVHGVITPLNDPSLAGVAPVHPLFTRP